MARENEVSNMVHDTEDCQNCAGTGSQYGENCPVCHGTGHQPLTRRNNKPLYIS